MKGMNAGRVILGGLVAGLVVNIGETILNVAIVADEWQQVMNSLGAQDSAGSIVFYIVGSFVIGLVGVYLYAAARPRLGAGPATAVKVGLLVWLLAWAWPTVAMAFWGISSAKLLWITLCWSVVEVPVAMLVGAWLYREEEVAA